MRRNNKVALEDFTQLPAGQDIGHRAILLDTADLNFGNEVTVAIDEQFTVLEDALVFTDIENDELPLRIGNQNLALQPWRKRHVVIGSFINREFVLDLLDFLAEQPVFLLGP